MAPASGATAAATGAATTAGARPTRTRRPARSISISVRPGSSSSFASSRIRSWSIAGLSSAMLGSSRAYSALPGHRGDAVDGERVAANAEAGDDRLGDERHIGVVPPGFARVDVADMSLDHWHGDRLDGV